MKGNLYVQDGNQKALTKFDMKEEKGSFDLDCESGLGDNYYISIQ